MKKRVRGFVIMDVMTGYAFWLGVSIFALPILLPKVATIYEAVQVERSLTSIKEQSLQRYFLSVLKTRCLPQASLSISDLTNAPNDGIATYEVRYRASSQPTKLAPLGIEIKATFGSSSAVTAIASYTNPERFSSANELIYFEPIENAIEFPERLHINPNTGCFT